MSKILVTGSASGLGAALCEALAAEGHDVVPYDIEFGNDVCAPRIPAGYDYDVPFDVLINCAGVNRIGWLQDFSEEDWDKVMDTNVKGMFLMTQHLRHDLKETNGTVLNIVSNAATMPMRCSAAYNASKGAALTLTKQLAREMIDDGITVFSVSPNKLSGTGMSDDIDNQVMATRGWTREEAQKYQIAGLITKEETPVAVLAEFITFLLSEKRRHKYLAGCNVQYGL
jgi:NAD(P)-dependent dehydrogenase (short-subunit alcohol dehydrogenase family)